MSEVKQYAERDLMAMDIAGNHYCRHVDHMTREKLHSKSDIAAELGWRDMQVAKLTAERDALAAEMSVMDAIHDKCLFISDDDYDACPKSVQEIIRSLAVMQIPTTSAYLNSVRAEGVESFAHHQRVIADALPGHESQRSHRITASRAEDFAKQLRAGKDGE